MKLRVQYITAFITCLLIRIAISSNAQAQLVPSQATINNSKRTLASENILIDNIGQYGKVLPGYENLGGISFGYEGLGMPVLFTPKGMIILQRKVEKISQEEEERMEKQGLPEEEIETKKKITERTITIEWAGANPDAEIIRENIAEGYHTYGLLTGKAYGYRKITYKNIYPGIDIVYSFTDKGKPGFEYSVICRPGADLGMVRMKLGGDINKIKEDRNGNILLRSDIETFSMSLPVSYYSDDLQAGKNAEVQSSFTIIDNEISFSFPQGYDHSKSLVVDPFITSTSNLTGINAGKAKDVDFDYAGNIYVTGGGDGGFSHSLAKYNAAGVLQWTFNGTLTIPSWNFGSYWGGWMVEKPTGNIYLGQGFNPTTGFQVIRVNTTGLYDNYITTANPNFREAWKMYWSCNNGSPQILVAGGGTNSDINFGVFVPPSTNIGSLNVTGIPYTGVAGWAQDIVDFIIDPANNDMYTIYGSLIGNPSLTNQVYKNTAPYSGASVAWTVPSGFTSVQEIQNRPYLVGGQIDNSANIFAINTSYLYYWDGKNLKAFDKATGNTVGTALVTANVKLMQGGIIADACNNVFVGDGNGVIKVYKFNGSVFDDAAAPDIAIPGYAGKAVYDLAYDESKKLLYASGDGFVASIDIAAYCPSTQYTLNVVPNCITASATVTVSPTPPAGAIVTYVLYNGTIQLATNNTGIFTGLNPGITYTIIATINIACSGTQATTTFIVPGPTIATTQTNTTCGASTASITATGSGTTAPYTYSIDGITFQASGTFSGLAAGVYTVTVKDANGCKSIKVLTLLNSNGPSLTYTNTNADCGSNNGTITATVTGGTLPYQYSINGVTYQASNFFTGLVGGVYTLTVKDASGCINAAVVTISSSPGPLITAIPATATCGSNNGTITAFGSGGTPPLQYSINGNTYQPSNVFNGVIPGTYTVYVKDANGCIKTVVVTVANSTGPTLAGTSTPAACSNVNGTITVTGTGGVAPLQYSINGITFQSGNVFTGLAAGSYTITVKDITGCTGIVIVTVSSTGGPSVTATSVAAGCIAANGSITVTATGSAPFQYSIDGGLTFQASNIFTGLPAGNYIVLARDVFGCIGTTSVVVAAIAGPSLTAVSTPSSCNVNTGIITATGTGGTAPLQYSIDGVTFQASNVFTGLAPDTYTITVRDANGCTKTITVSVANVAGLTLALSVINSSCVTSNGEITAIATGGAAPLQYSINGVIYQPGNVFTGLASGTYTVYVKDVNGCIVTRQAVIVSESGPSLSVTTIDATCGSSNAVIVATGSGGVDPLTYSINGVTYQSSGTFLNVAPGTYTVTVKDARGCIASEVVTISNVGTGPGISTFTVTAKSAYPCNGGLGKITNPRVNGANCNTCTFSLNFGPFIPNATQLFTNLSPGVYTVTAMDANGCTKTISVTIGLATLATVSTVVTGTSCNATTGTITLTGIGPNSPYHVSISGIGGPWITFDPTYTFTGLAPGVYTIISSDDESFDSGPPIDPGGCLDTVTVIVPSTGGPSLSVVNTPGVCGDGNGMITANGSGGVAPLQYSIDGVNYQFANDFTGLASGIYFVSVMDANGCVAIKIDTLYNAAAPELVADVTATTCGSNNGAITLTASGGTGPYQYSINGTAFQNSNIFSGLAAGNYTIYVKDITACYSTIDVTVINTPRPSVTAYIVAATCNNNDGMIVATGSSGTEPYQYSIDGTVFQSSNIFTGLSAGFYTVTIKDDSGCLNTTGVSVTNTAGPSITAAVTVAAKCNNNNGSVTITATGGTLPYQYSINGVTFQGGNIFPGLLPGTYTVTVKDNNGCITTRTILISNVNGPQVLTATVINAACGLTSGSITASASGGTAPLQYSIDGITYQAGTVFNGIGAGAYTLYVKDVNGCIKTLPVTVLNLSGPLLSATSSPASCGQNDGTITAIATGGTGTLTYSKDGITFQASNIFTGLAAGPYTITVKDTRGCTSTFNIIVTVIGATVTPTFNPVAAICSGATLSTLPTTSLNGISGTWSPALNNTATTIYTFTPSVGQCATTATLTITVNPNTTPTFNPVAAICSGATLSALPTTSLNGISGTWSPALNNIATTVYTFTPSAGQCATTTTLTITVNPNITPTFNPVAAICSGATLSTLPTTSLNGITGTWSPALNNTATTIYTFTPSAGQCATTATLTITVNQNITPTFNPVAAICSGATLSALPTTSLNGITGTWSPVLNNTTTTIYTFTPTAGQCATTATLMITVNPNITPTFNPVAAICSGATLSALPTTSLNGITGTWSPALNNTATTIYTFTPSAGQCATTATLTITVNPNITPTFNPVAAICSGATLSALPTTSLNGITGTWLPALNNTATTIYTFTPSAGQCAITATLTITVNQNNTPTFNPVAAICSGATLSALPTTSLNGISGTWSPALNNIATTVYTFTPSAGQCATTTTLTITVNPNITPTFNPVAAICSGATLSTLPTTSLNGITGTWSPALNNTATTIYTFTPSAGQCATTATLTITVNQNIMPTFNPVAAICSGATLSALPTTSLNGITGTWSPTLNNTATTIYTFTPSAGQCATIATLTITVNPNITPTFNPVAAICSGGTLSALPTTSLNGITGTWSPALNNTATTIYTFTPTAGQCATTTTLTITVNPNITPTFNPVAAICSGGTLSALPTTSLNGITGTWSPALNNTATTIYTFTPTAGQCATTTTLTITVNPILSATINCGVSTTNSVIFNWGAVTGATGYTISYQVNANPVVNVGAIGNVFTYQVTGLSAGDNVTITVLPTGAAGNCFVASTGTCSAVACNPPTASISYASPFCISVLTAQPVTLTGTGTFTGGVFSAAGGLTLDNMTGAVTPSTSTAGVYTVTYTIAASGGCPAVIATAPVTIEALVSPTFTPVSSICSGTALPALPTTSLNGITGTWSPALNNTATTVYTFTPSVGQCAAATTLTITVSSNVTPTFTGIGPLCQNSTAPLLPVTSTNGINGTWNPSTISTTSIGTTTHTFTPAAGQCAVTTTLDVSIVTQIVPTFAGIGPLCQNSTAPLLPLTSTNGINGTWNPSTISTTSIGTTTYTFTPAAGQCAIVTTLDITIATQITPTFNPVAAICSGGTLSTLPTTSLNGITGSWSPALNNTATTVYTFTPTAGQCATTTTLTITVNPNVTPTFNPVAAICSGATLSALPTTSLNGITGTWSPAVNNTATTIYTFTPSSGQCATTATLTITVNPNITPTFNPVAAICSGGTLSALPTTSLNGITGTWSPALNNTATTVYTFTPTAGQCATTATLTITVNSNITPTFNPVAAICSGATLSALPTTSLNGITGIWSPALNNAATTVYTFTPASGQCATTATLTITVNPNITPTFNPVAAICSGATLSTLPTTSLNGITGTWSPALNNTATTIYTFTPSAGQCATTATLTITVNPNITPTFNPVAAICSGATLSALPTTSLNGITGTWSPALNNTATTIYTFTPSTGQCATTATLTITVNPNITPTFNPVAAICSGATLSALPTTSLNGITGTWSPALNNTATTIYTFTPSAGQCATTTTLTITVNPNVTPTFNPVAAICSGATLSALPTTSLNGITGTWSPALNNTATTVYTFTPASGQCITTTTLTIVVNPSPLANAGNDVRTCFGKNVQLHGSGGSVYQWTPATNLSNAGIANPLMVLPPQGTYIYALNVTDVNGCKSRKPDTVVVTILPPVNVFAGFDTSIAIGQPLQLNATDVGNGGFTNYTWSPSTGLNNSSIQNPVAVLSNDITYTVTAITPDNCIAHDDINIKVFLGPEIYVPTGFTPNNDGLNDVIRPKLIGIRELKFFAIYNRYGEQVYITSDMGKGWNGIYKGQLQNTAAFVWVAEAVDYRGNVLKRKGSVVLIR